MNAVTFLFLVVGAALTALLYVFGVRRLLGLRFPFLRTLIAGVIAFLVASPIIVAIIPQTPNILPDLWFVILGMVIAFLVGMTLLVVAEVFVPSGSMPGPIYLARGLRKRLGRTKRYVQIVPILVRHGLLPYLQGGRRAEFRISDGRAHLAHSLRLALEEGGVTFVKLGQVLATRRDLLPDEFVTELSGLQDDVAPVAWPAIDQVIHAELGTGVDELFATFERTPSAAASIAQVYAATLSSGQRVVVKVCRPEAPFVRRTPAHRATTTERGAARPSVPVSAVYLSILLPASTWLARDSLLPQLALLTLEYRAQLDTAAPAESWQEQHTSTPRFSHL